MIAVIGTQSTNELIKTVLGNHRKNYDINYYHYTNTSQIENIVEEHTTIEGILFSGFVGLKAYENQKNKSNTPYGMITMDKMNLILGILELVLEYKDIDISRIYIDYLGMIEKYEKEFYKIIPESLSKKAQTFEFNNFSELTRENIYEDIKKKYESGDIDVAIVSAAKISKELEENPNKVYDIDLSYLTSRGKWYFISWKGDQAKSGGIASNIGVHFFDMLNWIFGDVEENIVHLKAPDANAGYLKLKHATVRWFLSVNYDYIPEKVRAAGQRTYRSITVDGEEIEFSGGFTDLHTRSYEGILKGNGFGLDEAYGSINTVSTIRNLEPVGLMGEYHPFCSKVIG